MGDKAPSKVVGFNSIGISDLLTQTKILSYSESDKKIGEILNSNNLNDFKTSDKLIDGLFGVKWMAETGDKVTLGVIDNPSKMIECLNNYKKSCNSKYYSTIEDAVNKINSRLRNMDKLTYHYTNFDDFIGNASNAEHLLDFGLAPEFPKIFTKVGISLA